MVGFSPPFSRDLGLVVHPVVHGARGQHLVQLVEDLGEDVGVEVGADLAEEEPLAHAQLVRDPVHGQVTHQHVGAGAEGGLAEGAGHDRQQSGKMRNFFHFLSSKLVKLTILRFRTTRDTISRIWNMEMVGRVGFIAVRRWQFKAAAYIKVELPLLI